jgi:hypothetical protein
MKAAKAQNWAVEPQGKNIIVTARKRFVYHGKVASCHTATKARFILLRKLSQAEKLKLCVRRNYGACADFPESFTWHAHFSVDMW